VEFCETVFVMTSRFPIGAELRLDLAQHIRGPHVPFDCSLDGGRADAVVLTGDLAFFEVDTSTPLCGRPLVACDGATPDDPSFCWASAAPATRRQQINHAIGEAETFILSPPDWSVAHYVSRVVTDVMAAAKEKATDAKYSTLYQCGSNLAAVHPCPLYVASVRQMMISTGWREKR
jgi:hypothetical protein